MLTVLFVGLAGGVTLHVLDPHEGRVLLQVREAAGFVETSLIRVLARGVALRRAS